MVAVTSKATLRGLPEVKGVVADLDGRRTGGAVVGADSDAAPVGGRLGGGSLSNRPTTSSPAAAAVTTTTPGTRTVGPFTRRTCVRTVRPRSHWPPHPKAATEPSPSCRTTLSRRKRRLPAAANRTQPSIAPLADPIRVLLRVTTPIARPCGTDSFAPDARHENRVNFSTASGRTRPPARSHALQRRRRQSAGSRTAVGKDARPGATPS